MSARLPLLAVLLSLAACGADPAPPPPPPKADSGPAFAFSSAAIALPAEEQGFPDGPHVEVMQANCAACHSPSMILNQPPLKPAQWAATIEKMQKVYRAPVADDDVPAILAYLAALPQQRALSKGSVE